MTRIEAERQALEEGAKDKRNNYVAEPIERDGKIIRWHVVSYPRIIKR